MRPLNSFGKPFLLAAFLLITLALSLAGLTSVAAADGPGDLDPTFGGMGVVTTSVGIINIGQGIALQLDGKIVVAGLSRPNSTDTDFTVLRYNADGSLDTTFNSTGIVTTSINVGYDWPYAVAVQADQKIIVVGFTSSDFNGYDSTLALVRYNSDGSLDTTFNGTGILTDSRLYGAAALALQPDGKIVVAGSGDCSGCVPVARYNPNGSPDLTFNGTGVVTTPVVNGYGRAFGLALQPDGKIVVAGATNWGQPDSSFAVIRYLPDGQLDQMFNGSGVVTTSTSGYALGVLVQPDNKILATGGWYTIRYNSDGRLDTSFNQTGVVTDTRLVIFAIALQPGGKIVATGVNYDQGSFMVARYNSNGSPDLTFNQTGLVTVSLAGSYGHGYDIVSQPDGKIVAGGNGQNGCFAVVRILGDRYQHFPLIVKSSGFR